MATSPTASSEPQTRFVRCPKIKHQPQSLAGCRRCESFGGEQHVEGCYVVICLRPVPRSVEEIAP